MKYPTKHNILSNNQFGLKKNHPTLWQFWTYLDNLSNSSDKKKFSVGVFIYLSKAFKAVNHKTFIEILKEHHYFGCQTTFQTGNNLSNLMMYCLIIKLSIVESLRGPYLDL